MDRRTLLSMLVLALAGCERGTPVASSPATRPMTIAVIPKGTSHEFWKTVQAGALKGGAESGVEVLWKGPAREDDRDEQIKVVEAFITRKVDGIVIAPLDSTALVRPLQAARDAGIGVTIFDSGLEWDGYASFVATDNRKGGALAATEMGRLLGGSGTVIVLRYVEGSASTHEREEGFLETLAGQFPGIEVLSSDQYAGATLESGLRSAENLLTRFPTFDGAYAPNESSASALMKALTDARRKEGVRLVGFDSSEALVNGLRDGQIDALVVQNPFGMGERAVKAMADALAGRSVEKRIDTGCTLVTKATMDEPATRELLSPDLSGWLK